MAKYNVGVGDAFPVDQPEKPPEPETAREREPDLEWSWGHRRRRHRYSAFKAVVILLGIWLVLFMVNGHSTKGLLIAAGILFAVGVANRLFGRSRDDRRDERRRRNEEAGL